jgi:hypothetical protein
MKLYPSAEVMNEATSLLEPLVPESECEGIYQGHCSDLLEIVLWRGRQIDSVRVKGTLAGVMELPCLVIDFNRGRLS